MMLYKLKTNLSFILLFLSFPALSASDETPDRISTPYPYVGARIGLGHFFDACGANAISCDKDSYVYGGYLGYQLTPLVAFESGLTDYGDIEAHYNSSATSSDSYGADLSVLLTYDFDSDWRVFGRLGGAWQDIDKSNTLTDDVSESGWNSILGVGIDYALSKNWSLRGEYQYMDGFGGTITKQADLSLASIGLSYRFVQPKTSDSEKAIILCPTEPKK